MAWDYAWDHPDTVHFYESFCDAHPRYQTANEALIAAAEILPGMRVLDVAAGTGRTSALAPAPIRLTCIEPSAAMREPGERRLPQARWLANLPETGLFDRILCGAAIWQMQPIAGAFEALDRLLAPGGRLVFNMPSAYLGEPDPPGDGRDAYLLELISKLPPPSHVEDPVFQIPEAGEMLALLRACGLTPRDWQCRSRLTQCAYRDWLKIPVLTNRLLPYLDAWQRAAALDEASEGCDPASWRWETWTGWTCEKDPGYFLARGVIDTSLTSDVRERAMAICKTQGWIDAESRVISPGLAPLDPAILNAQAMLQSQPAFDRLREAPGLRALLEGIFDGPFSDRHGDVWRIVFPDRPDLSTPPHCDQTYVGHERTFWTAWIPLTDCPLDLGPLAVLNRFGEWLPQPMQEGDVLLFDRSTMHKALDNRRAGKLRLSVDLRFAV